jgi:hypothetical protein
MTRVLSYAAAGLLLLTATRAFPQGLDCLKTGNLAEFAALTADDAVFVDAHGPASKAEAVKHTSEFRLDDYTIEDVKFLQLSSKSGPIAYKNRKGKWLCIFSQETAADDLEV